ncbi:MAG: helix-turn-helix transcriptional regulator, partial [Opitutaceae bacterium]
MDLHLFQKDAARQIGAGMQALINWEKGRSEPEVRFIPGIIAFLGYDPRPKPGTLGERLIAFRVAKGWARPRLAKDLRVDPSTLARWETGKRRPWGAYVGRVTELLRDGVADGTSFWRGTV